MNKQLKKLVARLGVSDGDVIDKAAAVVCWHSNAPAKAVDRVWFGRTLPDLWNRWHNEQQNKHNRPLPVTWFMSKEAARALVIRHILEEGSEKLDRELG